MKTEVVENPPSPSGGMHRGEGAKKTTEMDPGGGRQKSPPPVKHAPNLTTSKTPKVPKEERDPPNSRRVREEVMSRDGYYCRNTGCDNICDECNHTEERSCGGPSTRENNGSFCKPCHNGPIHGEESLLVSGRGDDLILSDGNHRPLARRPSEEDTSIEIEVERPPENPEEGIEEAPREDPREESAATVAPPGMRLVEFLGQKEAVEGLSIAIQAAKARGEFPRPILLAGPPGLGKTTLARSIARELGARLHITCGPNLTDPAVLRGVLSGLGKNEILFIDEIHRMPHAVAECLYQALDDGTLSVTVETEAGHRIESRKIEPFLLVGATTEESLLPRPLHNRFSLKRKLDFYSTGDLEEIVRLEGKKLGTRVSPEGARILAGGSRGTPRQLISNLHQARDVAQIRKGAPGEVDIDAETASRALELQGIDSRGLDRMDRKILQVLLDRARPMGLRTLADLAGENRRTIAEIHEPYLLRKGLMARTHKGRVATEKARRLFTFRAIA